MKFYCSDFEEFNSKDGAQHAWIDYGLDEKASIAKYFEDMIKVYDADICGHVEIEFIFENERAFKIDYSWWITHDPHWEIHDELHVKEVAADDLKMKTRTYRDYMVKGVHNALLREFMF